MSSFRTWLYIINTFVRHSLFIITINDFVRDETHQEAFVHIMIVLAVGVGLRILGGFLFKF